MVDVTYNAPKGDELVVTMRGVRFYDGRAESLDEFEHGGLIAKLRNNQHFTVEGGEAVKEPEPPRSGLKAAHHGGGRFVIKDGDTIVKDGLNKADADAFNALSDEDKAAYVE